MVKWQGLSKRKPSGARRRFMRSKRKFEYGREAAHTRLGEFKKIVLRVRSGVLKHKPYQANKANVFNPKTKKSVLTDIEGVEETPASRHFKRSNIITKSAILKTKVGYAQVTNRPGQEGQIQAKLVDYEPAKSKKG